MTALQRYLAREDAREEVVDYRFYSTRGKGDKDGWCPVVLADAALNALAEELERADKLIPAIDRILAECIKHNDPNSALMDIARAVSEYTDLRRRWEERSP